MSSAKLEKVKQFLTGFELSAEQLENVAQIMSQEINYGLHTDENMRRKTILPMIKTFLHETPESAHDRYLGIDLGSSNFRVILADLTNKDPKFDTETDPLPKEYYGLPCRNLYDFMASKVAVFLKKRNLENESLKLGYTFSFPSVQESVNCAKLITWTQTFHCPDGVGEDAGKLLQDALDRQGCKVNVACVLNDTTATLVAGAFVDPRCAIGVIVGTGANAAYYESMDRIKWFADRYFPENPPKKMIIDIESGCFGDNGTIDFVKTKYDFELDRTSLHPASYTFEKLYSGHFFGEICRLVLSDLAAHGLFASPEVIPGPWNLTSTQLSPVNSDSDSGDFPATRNAMENIGILPFCDDNDVKVVHKVVRTVTKRAGDIVAAHMAALVRHIGQREITIAFDGSFYRCQPHFATYIGERLSSMCPDYKVKLFCVHDGSGRGGALAAATV